MRGSGDGEAFSGRVGRRVATAGASRRLRALPLPQVKNRFCQVWPSRLSAIGRSC